MTFLRGFSQKGLKKGSFQKPLSKKQVSIMALENVVNTVLKEICHIRL